MKRLVLLLGVLAGCDPIWDVHTTIRDPANRPIEGATLALAYPDGVQYSGEPMAVRTDRDGVAHVGGLGSQFPVGCDVFVAMPGYQTQRVHYADLCPAGPRDCDRVYGFDLVLQPE